MSDFKSDRARNQFGGQRDLAGMIRYLNGSRAVTKHGNRDEDIEGNLEAMGLVGSVRDFIPAFNPAEREDHQLFRDMGLDTLSTYDHGHRPFWVLVLNATS